MTRITALILSLAVATGCTATGEEGLLRFQIENGLIDTWGPTASGAAVLVHVSDATSADAEAQGAASLVVTGASLGNAQAGEVIRYSGSDVTLALAAAGDVELAVQTDIGDDRVGIEVREAEVSLNDSSVVTVVVGGEAQLGYTLRDAAGETLLGSMVEGWSYTSDAGGRVLGPVGADVIILQAEAAGTGTVAHPQSEADLDVVAVAVSAVTNLALNAQTYTEESAEVDGGSLQAGGLVFLDPKGSLEDGTDVLGVQSLLAYSSSDEAVCYVAEEVFFEVAVKQVVLEGPGDCVVTASLGELEQTLSFTVTAP